jgi:hypothetical protein
VCVQFVDTVDTNSPAREDSCATSVHFAEIGVRKSNEAVENTTKGDVASGPNIDDASALKHNDDSMQADRDTPQSATTAARTAPHSIIMQVGCVRVRVYTYQIV